MSKVMKIISCISVIFTIMFLVLFNQFKYEIFYTLVITFGTIAYHFLMRLAVGYSINFIYKNYEFNKSYKSL